MATYLVSPIIKGKTHIYEEELTSSKDMVAPRCKPSTTVKISNTKKVDDGDLESYIRNGEICSHCLRHKGDIVLKENFEDRRSISSTE